MCTCIASAEEANQAGIGYDFSGGNSLEYAYDIVGELCSNLSVYVCTMNVCMCMFFIHDIHCFSIAGRCKEIVKGSQTDKFTVL